MPSVHLSSGSVHYTEHGQGEPLVLLHASPGDGRNFAAIIPALAEDYRVLALDWPGYGQSDLPQESQTVGVSYFYRTLLEFVDALALPPAFLVGNSVGGNAAARLAIAAPAAVRGLVLVAPGGFTAHNEFTRAFCKIQSGRFSLPPYRFASLYLRRRTPVTTAMLRRASSLQATPERVALGRSLWRSFGLAENDLRAVANRIRAPTLLLFGKHDPVISARKDGAYAAAGIPAARLAVLPCGHASFAEAPELFLAEVRPFWAELSKTPSLKPVPTAPPEASNHGLRVG